MGRRARRVLLEVDGGAAQDVARSDGVRDSQQRADRSPLARRHGKVVLEGDARELAGGGQRGDDGAAVGDGRADDGSGGVETLEGGERG